MSFDINNEKLLEKCKSIWTKLEDLKNIELNALPDRQMYKNHNKDIWPKTFGT